MLVELPNGDWLAPESVRGVRILTDREHGPRVVLDTSNAVSTLLIEFGDAEAAKGWAKQFAERCNAAAKVPA